MTRHLPATGLTLPDATDGWTLSTPAFSDWHTSDTGGGCTTSVRLDGRKVGTLTWDGQGAPEITIDDDATWGLWQAAADATAAAPNPALAATGHPGPVLLALTLIAETNTARTWRQWSKTSTVLALATDPDAVHTVPTPDRERATTWAAQAGGYSAWWDPDRGSWVPL